MTDTTKTKLHLGKNGWAVCEATQRACPIGGEENHIEVVGTSKEALQFLNDVGISVTPAQPARPNTALDIDPDTVTEILQRVMRYMPVEKRRELVETIGEYSHAPGYDYAGRYDLIEASLVSAGDDSVYHPTYSRDAARMIFVAGGVATTEERNGKLNFYNLSEPNPVYKDTPVEELGPGDMIALRSRTVNGAYTKVHAEVLRNGALPTQEFGRPYLLLETSFTDPYDIHAMKPKTEPAYGEWSVRQPTESAITGR